MEFALDRLNAEDVLHKLINVAADQLPFGGGVVNYVVDTVFFPTPEVDIWKEVEGRVQQVMQSRLDDVIAAHSANTAANLLARLRAFSNQLREFTWITDRQERKTRLAFMVTQLEAALAECVSFPSAHLLMLPDVLRPLSLAHVAVLMELKALEPHRYEHQAALNHTAIMYSDLAGKLFERAMAWRRAMIGEGKGTLVMNDLFVTDKTKTVEIIVYDRFKDNRWQPGERGIPAFRVSAGGLYVNQHDQRFDDLKTRAYAQLTAYDEQVQKEYTALWEKKLLNYTKEFMKLVDWPGVEREKKGEAGKDRRVLTFPITIAPAPLSTDRVLDRLDLFLEQQMDQFTVAGPRYAQTYRLPADALAGPHAVIHTRADTYDTSVACIYFQERGDLERARDLADALVVAQNHDAKGGGRIVAATRADELLDPGLANVTSEHVHDGGRRDVGNMSWAGIALTRMYHRTGRYRYLHAAETIGRWIVDNCAVKDDWAGFSGGEDQWGGKYLWRSVEHNVDAFSLFGNLHHLTGDAKWEAARASARRLVIACRVKQGLSRYVTGTGTKMELNAAVIPTDTQSWTALAGIDPGPAEAESLQYMVQTMSATSAGFEGTKFAQAGKEIQNEATAGAAMALWLRGGDSLRPVAQRWADSLVKQIAEAKNGDGYGVVATPVPEAETGPGLGWKYFNFLHVASTAWTGLLLLARDDPGANPYAPLSAVKKG
jgi:hypothetical protein